MPPVVGLERSHDAEGGKATHMVGTSQVANQNQPSTELVYLLTPWFLFVPRILVFSARLAIRIR